MTTTIELTIRRRMEVHDDQLRYIEHFLKRGIKRIDASATAAPFVGDNCDEDLVDAYVVGQLVIVDGVPACSLCGSTQIQYSEGVGCFNELISEKTQIDEQGTLLIFGGNNYTEGDSHPGVECGSCYAALDTDGDVEIDWS